MPLPQLAQELLYSYDDRGWGWGIVLIVLLQLQLQLLRLLQQYLGDLVFLSWRGVLPSADSTYRWAG